MTEDEYILIPKNSPNLNIKSRFITTGQAKHGRKAGSTTKNKKKKEIQKILENQEY